LDIKPSLLKLIQHEQQTRALIGVELTGCHWSAEYQHETAYRAVIIPK